MEIDGWFSGYKVRSFPWIDGKTIYFNVQCFAPGQSLSQPPAWNKTVYVTDNEAGRRIVHDFTASLAEHVAGLEIKPGTKIILTV
jgi:hypothetical protein